MCSVGSSTSTRPPRSPASRRPYCLHLWLLRLRSPGTGRLNSTAGRRYRHRCVTRHLQRQSETIFPKPTCIWRSDNRDRSIRAPQANVRCLGKGRKQRCTPLTTATVAVVRAWLRERGTDLSAPLFPTVRNSRLSSDAVQQLVTKHVQRAASACPSLLSKHVTPHTLRHTAAMRLLHAGVDPVVIALWLGHERIETTNVYVHADITLKERALARTVPVAVKPGRYRAPDPLLAFLESL